jgi:ketosteroid isomerase-like protein
MSRENVDLVLGLMLAPDVDIAPLFRDDEMWAALVDVVAPLIHREFECTGTLFGTETTYGGGVDGFRSFWLDWTAPWVTYRSETEEIFDLEDRVLQFAREFGRRDGNTEEVMGSNAAVWTFRDGKIVRFDAYADRAVARKAAGLAE